jgi:hypothetical protein
MAMAEAVASGAKKIHADPTKDFFVTMITRDIALEDCIFDLLDNSIDGARRNITDVAERKHPFAGATATIEFDDGKFSIEDNCGGIRLADAIDYAFHFGRRRDSPRDVDGGIGLYGIGMKRAIFKIGRKATVRSEASDACFTVGVDVQKWEASDDWDFDYEDAPRLGINGTRIDITSLYPAIGLAFTSQSFRNQLIRMIARDYSFFIDKGLQVRVGDHLVQSLRYQLRQNEELIPAVVEYEDEGVRVRLVSGIIDDLPDEIDEEYRPEKVERSGWYVVCNDRVVVAGDKTDQTIWGTEDYRVWHPQYNNFAGFCFFTSDDQRKLPWTTTKRTLDAANPIYRRAMQEMRKLTDEFVAYTNRRKEDIDAAKKAEIATQQVDVFSLVKPQALRLPAVAPRSTSVSFANINYKRPLSDIALIRNHKSRPALTYREIGEMTFDYYLKMELGK